METRKREAVRTLVACCALLALSAGARGWEPNTGDLDAAIKAGDFAGYSDKLSTWLGAKVPAGASRISEAALDALLEDSALANALAQRQLISKVGADNMAAFARGEERNRDFLTWLLRNTEAMEGCLEGATPVAVRQREENGWTIPVSALEIWSRILVADPESKEGLLLRLAVATGLNPPGTGNRGAGQAEKPEDPVDRYRSYKKWHRDKELASCFDDLTVWEYRQIVSSNASDADLAWAREAINTWRPDLRVNEQVILSTSAVWYRNSPIPFDNTFRNVLAGGGKCGPRSSWAVFVCQAFGIPAVGVGQPGHACAAYKSVNPYVEPQPGNAWKVSYGRGWHVSRVQGTSGPEFLEGVTARSKMPRFMQVERLRWLASACGSKEQADAVLKVARMILETTLAADMVPLDSKPSAASDLRSFEAPTDDGDGYVARVRGFVHPPATGDYVFRIASDDDSQLLLSSDESPGNKRRIASVVGCTEPKQFDKFPTQKSEPVRLERGKRYYIEAAHREASGGDNLSVAWSGPGVGEGVIQGRYLSPYPSGRKGRIVREVWRDLLGPATKPEARPESPLEAPPGVVHVEAEAYAKMAGVSVFDCRTGGKQVNFHQGKGDGWAEYTVAVPAAGVYALTMRAAAANVEQTLSVSADGKEAVTVAVPNTNGLWGTTEAADIELRKGSATLRVSAPAQRGVALRWFELKPKRPGR